MGLFLGTALTTTRVRLWHRSLRAAIRAAPQIRSYSNWTAGWSIGNIWNMILQSGITPDPDKLLDLARAIQNGKVNYSVAGGTANAVTATWSPAPAALAAGLRIAMKMASEPTGAVTINLNGLGAVAARDPRGMDFIGGEWSANDIIVWAYNGTEWRAQNIRNKSYRYDLSTLPGADVALNVGDKLTLTFTNVATIPLYTATSEGLYAAKLLISATNTNDSNWLFKPNNTTYVNAFSYGVIEHADVEITSSAARRPMPVLLT